MTEQADANVGSGTKSDYYLRKLDFLDWYRYYYIVKAIIKFNSQHILEIGSGSGIVKNCLQPFVSRYMVLDINPRLQPDIVADVRVYRKEFEKQFDCVIAADVLEHIPFPHVERSLCNLHRYLRDNGKAVLTVPHRRSHFLFMTPTYKPHIMTIPTGLLSPGAFYRRFINRQIWIDPDHCWEIGDGRIKKSDVEVAFRNAGFSIESFRKLLYVDFWTLKKDYGRGT